MSDLQRLRSYLADVNKLIAFESIVPGQSGYSLEDLRRQQASLVAQIETHFLYSDKYCGGEMNDYLTMEEFSRMAYSNPAWRKKMYHSPKPTQEETIIRECANSKVTITIGISVLALQLIFSRMQTEQGRQELLAILQKTLPNGCTLDEAFQLESVVGHDDLVDFELVADNAFLVTPQPSKAFKVKKPYRLDKEELKQAAIQHPVKTIHGSIRLAPDTFTRGQLPATTDVEVWTKPHKIDGVLSQASGQGILVEPSNSFEGLRDLVGANYGIFSNPDIQKGEPTEPLLPDSPVLDILTRSHTACTDGKHIVFRSDLDTYSIHEAQDGLPGKKIGVATTEDELRALFKEIYDKAFAEELETGTKAAYISDMDAHAWRSYDY